MLGLQGMVDNLSARRAVIILRRRSWLRPDLNFHNSLKNLRFFTSNFLWAVGP